MKPFNLAESRIAQRTYCQTHLNQRIRMIGLFAAIAVVVALISCACNAVISARAEKARVGLENVAKRSESIKRNTDSAKAELDQRQWQDQLAKTSDSWLTVINNTLDCLPSDAWVTRIETSPKDSTLVVEGRAATFDSLSAFINGLRRNPAFSEIQLSSARIVRIAEISCIDFSVPIKLTPTAAGKPPEATAQASDLLTRRPGA